jgi:hypothetical protein
MAQNHGLQHLSHDLVGNHVAPFLHYTADYRLRAASTNLRDLRPLTDQLRVHELDAEIQAGIHRKKDLEDQYRDLWKMRRAHAHRLLDIIVLMFALVLVCLQPVIQYVYMMQLVCLPLTFIVAIAVGMMLAASVVMAVVDLFGVHEHSYDLVWLNTQIAWSVRVRVWLPVSAVLVYQCIHCCTLLVC